MLPLDGFTTRLQSRLRAMPENVARQFLREAARDVCERAHCWKEEVLASVPAEWNPGVEVPLPEKVPWDYAHVFREGPRSRPVFAWTGRGFRCHCPFFFRPGQRVRIEVELSPGTSDLALEEIPPHVWDMAGNAILETAVAKAASQVGRPWGDPTAYQTAIRAAADEINRIVNTSVRAETRMHIYQLPPIGETE